MVRLQDVVTQPYDKISPAMQQAYYQRSPYNLVRIILGLPELFDGDGAKDVYRRAEEILIRGGETEFLRRRANRAFLRTRRGLPLPAAETAASAKGSSRSANFATTRRMWFFGMNRRFQAPKPTE